MGDHPHYHPLVHGHVKEGAMSTNDGHKKPQNEANSEPLLTEIVALRQTLDDHIRQNHKDLSAMTDALQGMQCRGHCGRRQSESRGLSGDNGVVCGVWTYC